MKFWFFLSQCVLVPTHMPGGSHSPERGCRFKAAERSCTQFGTVVSPFSVGNLYLGSSTACSREASFKNVQFHSVKIAWNCDFTVALMDYNNVQCIKLDRWKGSLWKSQPQMWNVWFSRRSRNNLQNALLYPAA